MSNVWVLCVCVCGEKGPRQFSQSCANMEKPFHVSNTVQENNSARCFDIIDKYTVYNTWMKKTVISILAAHNKNWQEQAASQSTTDN